MSEQSDKWRAAMIKKLGSEEANESIEKHKDDWLIALGIEQLWMN